MDVDNVVKLIPSVVSSFYEYIYIVKENADLFYNIEYNGFELKVSKPKKFLDFTEKVSNYKDNIIELLNINEPVKKIIDTKDNKQKLVTIDTVNEYKVVFITDISKPTSKEEKKILLIADDSPVITKFFTKIFMNEFDVVVASNGNEAIELINQYMDKPLVGVFLDLQMPIKNGFEVLEYFKENNLFGKIPVSIISGEDSADGIAKATEYSGVVDMLQKPFSVDSAKAIVAKTIAFSPYK